MAAIGAAKLAKAGVVKGSNALVYTFGQPRPGNYEFAKLYNQLMPNTFRVVNNLDPVPHVSPCPDDPSCPWVPTDGPCPCGTKESLLSYGYHGGTEIWYAGNEYHNGVMCDYRECDHDPNGLGEDYSCSDKIVPTTHIGDHSGYWDVIPPKAPLGQSFCKLPPARGHPKPREMICGSYTS
jgi:hypothetical protein